MTGRSLISIIDDDESMRVALAGLLRSVGHRAVAFPSAEAFLADAAAGESACIVTDVQMPGLSGIELKHRLEQSGCAAPVIMITARTEESVLERARASGAFCVLRKPFAVETLIDCLERALTGPAEPG